MTPPTPPSGTVVLVALIALTLTGCDGSVQLHKRFTDEKGCDWDIDYTIHRIGGDVVSFDHVKPRLDDAGKQVCGK